MTFYRAEVTKTIDLLSDGVTEVLGRFGERAAEWAPILGDLAPVNAAPAGRMVNVARWRDGWLVAAGKHFAFRLSDDAARAHLKTLRAADGRPVRIDEDSLRMLVSRAA